MNQTMGLDCPIHSSVVSYAGGALLDRHVHSSASVSIVLAGSIEEAVGQKIEVGRIGILVAKPAEVEHSNRVGRDGAILLAVKGREAAEVVDRRWRWIESRDAIALGLQLARSLKKGAAVEAEQLFDLLGLAALKSDTSRGPAWITGIRTRLNREPNPPSVTELAQQSGVHPVYLARAFRKQFGCSIRDYRRTMRVRRAADLLAGCNLPISAVAASLDFFDQSHLCRDFKAEMKVSPTEYRAIVRS